MSAATGLFTCITCRVGFHDMELQRDHYKSDWHRYNLKRKIINELPVTADIFQERLKEHEATLINNQKSVTHYCSVCKKTFGNDKALQSHLVSNKHLQAVKELTRDDPITPIQDGQELMETSNATESLRPENEGDMQSCEQQNPVVKTSEKKMEIDTTNNVNDEEEDWEEVEGTPIPINTCLFCEKESKNCEKNLEHMSVVHSFFIPDAEYCVDTEGLVEYLGEKVGEGMMCLWCNERGKSFYTVLAAQQHMRDKGHCKMLHEGETLFEYTDFYDYSSSYPEEEQGNSDEIYQPEPVHFNENMQLVLPSGVALGHRALKIYYKQYIRPTNQLVQHRQTKTNKLLQQYKAIGYGETPLALAQQKHRDQKYFQRIRSKHHMKTGMQGNSTLQKHFRRQVQF